MIANGGSQVVDEPTGLLLILEAPLRTCAVAKREGFEARLRWMRRCYIQDTDVLSKFFNRMGFSLAPEWLAHVWQRFGPLEVSRYASPLKAPRVRFNPLIDSVNAKGAKALTKDWRSSVSLVLPDFHDLDAAVLIVPSWPHRAWFRRLHSVAWAVPSLPGSESAAGPW